MTFDYRDPDGDTFTARPTIGTPTPAILLHISPTPSALVPLDRVEEVVAGIRDAARQATGQQPETVPTPEEGIEDARKVIQHVLQLFLDRVPRNELDAETMADSVTDALSDGLTELYRSLAQAETALAAVGQPAEAQAADEARPPVHRWAAELHDPLADEWIPGTRYLVRDRAVAALAHAREVGPTWKDGTPVERRLVRETTTWTVEDETR